MGSRICAWCKNVVLGPKIIYQGQWCCATCMYYIDKGELPPASVRE